MKNIAQGNDFNIFFVKVAGVTGLEPATSGVTGRHSNQLSYTRVSLREEEKCGLRATHDGVKRNVRGC